MGIYKEISKAVKVQIYPTKKQEIVFEQNINHARFVFNKVKESCEYHYKIIKEQGINPNLINNKFCNIILTQLKQSNDFLYIIRLYITTSSIPELYPIYAKLL